MEPVNKILSQLNNNRIFGYSLIRIFLGVALLVRGWALASNPGDILELVRDGDLHMWFSYITIGHLIGGFCLIFGLLTRLAALLQIPILIGAVLVSEKGLMMGGQSLELATLVLFLLIMFFVFGPGPIAVSAYVNKNNKEKQPESDLANSI